MRYRTNHYFLEFWSIPLKKYVTGSENHDIERLKILAKKPYFNYNYMGKKRIRKITAKTIWESK